MMDPDATLAAIREAIAAWESAPDGSVREHEAAERATSAMGALDDWLSHGYRMPNAWRSGTLAQGPEIDLGMLDREGLDGSWPEVSGAIDSAERAHTVTWLTRTRYAPAGSMGAHTRRVAAIMPIEWATLPGEPDEAELADAARPGEADISDRRSDEVRLSVLMDAIDRASDQDGMTWITIEQQRSTGTRRRIAAIVPVDTAETAEKICNPAYVISMDSGPLRVAEAITIRRMPGGELRMWLDGDLFEYGTVEGFTWQGRRKEVPSVTLSIPAMRVQVSDSLAHVRTPEHPHVATAVGHWHEDDGTVRTP